MKKTILISIFTCWYYTIYAQSLTPETITTGGHYFEQPIIGSLQGTIGETITGKLENEVILTQGFQQFYLTITPVFEVDYQTFHWNIFPNPTADLLHFETDFLDAESVDLLDQNGRLIETKQMEVGYTSFSIASLPAALYILRLRGKNSFVKSWKVQKISK